MRPTDKMPVAGPVIAAEAVAVVLIIAIIAILRATLGAA